MAKKKTTEFSDVPSYVDSDALEQEILTSWEKGKVFEKSLAQNKKGPRFTFYDGPPYATGKPHYGHILQSAIKDTVLRYKTMRGYYVPRRVGWDCHGLPVETLVEKELGFKTKRDIEKLGIEKFNQKCREVVFRYIDEFTSTLQRVGRWAEYDQAYATLNLDYMDSEWWVFRQLWDRGLVYKGFRSTPYCVRCETPLSNVEVTMGYKDKTDLAVYVLLAVSPTSFPKELRRANQQVYLLIWTTTPWTLPGNAAVAINPKIEYVSVEWEGKEIIVAGERVKNLFGPAGKSTKTWRPEELRQLTYEPLYALSPETDIKGAYRVVAGEHVSAQEGSGLVHTAPAFGEEDFNIGKQYGLPVFRTVETDGRFAGNVPQWAGQPIFEANLKIVEDLKTRAVLFKEEQYTHTYPFCWRCDTPLIYYALDTWFARVTELKERMLKINEQIHWTPEHVKHGRFSKGIESAPDWAISRNRFWSVPLPIWVCEQCQEQVCVGSIEELKKLSGRQKILDIHRPYVDEITWPCATCGGQMKRVPEVLDVWFDSGSMPYAQWHYPFEKKEFVEKGFPADFIAESIEMTRAWFYFLHVLATALTTKDIGLGKDKPAFKNAIASGLIFAEDGQKFSKKLKNYPEIQPTIKKYGADILRFYLLSSASLGEPYRFSEKELRELKRNSYSMLWNVYSFFVRYAKTHGWQPKDIKKRANENVLDQWILARVKVLEREVLEKSEAYQIDMAARLFIPFIDDLSNWYLRRSRARFQPAGGVGKADTLAAFQTLYSVLVQVAKLLAPFMPFLAEAMYRNLTKESSVHLARLIEATLLDEEEEQLILNMNIVRHIVSQGLSLRAQAKIKVRQPLAHFIVSGQELPLELAEIIRDEVNVKRVSFGSLPADSSYMISSEETKMKVALRTEITPELRGEGLAREIIRHGQVLRREAQYELNDRIVLVYTTNSKKLEAVLENQKGTIMATLQADEVISKAAPEDAGKDLEIEGESLHLGVRKK